MRHAEPKSRLADFPVGTRVTLEGVERPLIVSRIRDDGYVDLKNQAGFLSVTASSGHECKEEK